MSQLIEETNPNPLVFLSDEQLADTPENETIGSGYLTGTNYITLQSDYILESLTEVQKITNPVMKQKAIDILINIQKLIDTFNSYQCDINNIPKLNSHGIDDNGFLIEFTGDLYRIGFSLEEEISESGWYLTTNEDMGSIGASGFLKEELQIKKLIFWLLCFSLTFHE